MNDEKKTDIGDPNLNNLLNCIDEFITQVNSVANDFEKIDQVARQAKKVVSDKGKFGGYSYRTYTGQFVGNLIKPWFESKISPEQHDTLFQDSAWHMGVGFMMSKQLADVSDELKRAQTPEDAAKVFANFSAKLQGSLGMYMQALQRAPQLQIAFMDLKGYQQKLLDSTAKESTGVVLGTDYGVVSHPFQHLGRIPLLLEQIIKYADNCEKPEIKETAMSLKETHKESQAKLREINATVPQVKYK